MKRLILISILLLTSLAHASDVKDPDLAGSWYPASKQALTDALQKYLDDAHPEKIDGKIFAIISPHAGYRFSGPVAAYGYKLVENRDIKTVILIGFSHRRSFDGISIYDRGSFATPLGEIAVDTKLAQAIAAQARGSHFIPRRLPMRIRWRCRSRSSSSR
jgi:AmmeMemoRadiSam system protein B